MQIAESYDVLNLNRDSTQVGPSCALLPELTCSSGAQINNFLRQREPTVSVSRTDMANLFAYSCTYMWLMFSDASIKHLFQGILFDHMAASVNWGPLCGCSHNESLTIWGLYKGLCFLETPKYPGAPNSPK